MKRELKFRGYYKPHNKMYYEIGEGSEEVVVKGVNQTLSDYQNDENWEIMQYIGMTDSSGKPIYEKDIVKDRFGRIMRIGYWNYRLCFIAITKTNFHHADFYHWIQPEYLPDYDNENFPPARTTCEIIGNTHEHPNLLNQ